MQTKKHSLRDAIYSVAIAKEYNSVEMYGIYSDFLDIFPDLTYSNYTRWVRRVFQQNIRPMVEKTKKGSSNMFGISNVSATINKEISEISFNNELPLMRKGKFKRIAIISDTHCGHILGLTPPVWQYSLENEDMYDISRMQREAWDWYVNTIDMVGKKVDVLVVNGDLIDGRAERSGGTELITTDRHMQISMGVTAIKQWKAKQIFMTRGTPYHTGKDEQFEDYGAEQVGAHISDTIDFSINGVVFNFRHKVGSTSVPYGRATQVSKEATMNKLYSLYADYKQADVVVRSHVHYMVTLRESSKIAITTPALQVNSRYGKQQCTGITDFGFIIIDVYENGYTDVTPYLANLKMNKPHIHEID